MSDELQVCWAEVPMGRLVQFWCDAYSPPVESMEWFYDAAKQTVVLKLYVRTPKNDSPACVLPPEGGK